MGRAVNPPLAVRLALLVALGFGACMPEEVEVGRDATLDPTVGVGSRASSVHPSGDAGERSTDAGSDGQSSSGHGGATADGGATTSWGGNGGVAGTPSSQSGGRGSMGGSPAGVSGVGGDWGTAGGAVLTGGTAGGTSTLDFDCPEEGSQDVLWTLEMFCSAFSCPTSADGAKDLLARSFDGCPGLFNEVRTGCGLSQISVTTESLSDAFVYAEDTAELVGAAMHADKPWGPCNVFRYYAGVLPRGCQAATACAFCGSMATCP
jgi:hypothetical protein